MTEINTNTLERLRAWRQIDVLLKELAELIWRWRENDPQLELTLKRLHKSTSLTHRQLYLPFRYNDPYPTHQPTPRCPLCIARQWP